MDKSSMTIDNKYMYRVQFCQGHKCLDKTVLENQTNEAYSAL